MAITLLDRRMDETLIVDDQRDARDAYEETVEDAELTPLAEEGPLPATAGEYYRLIQEGPATAALCDHMLAHRNYAIFTGAELVAELTRNGFPAVLCTDYRELIDDIRPYRQWIPSLQHPGRMTPDDFVHGLEDCLLEISGKFKPHRRAWRTLVKIVGVHADENRFLAEVPAWAATVIPLKFVNVPAQILEQLEPEFRCRARVNLGAESLEDIYFTDWELVT